jgi:hypothetical protein
MPLSSVVGAQSIIKPGVCTSSTRPAVPFEGQMIYETDTDVIRFWNGTRWVSQPTTVGYKSRTSNYTVYAGVITSASDIFTGITLTADGNTTYKLEFQGILRRSATATGYVVTAFFDGSSGLGTSDWLYSDANPLMLKTTHMVQYVQPSSGSHTYNVRAAVGNGATASYEANNAVLGTGDAAMFFRVSVAEDGTWS